MQTVDISSNSPNSEELDFNMDTGAVTIGYEYPFYTTNNITLSSGISLMVRPLNEGDINMVFNSIYISPSYKFDNKLSAWISFGMNKPEKYIKDFSIGLEYGGGIHYKINKNIGASLGYIMNNTSIDENTSWWQSNIATSRLIGYITFSL